MPKVKTKKISNERKVICGVSFPSDCNDLECLLWLFQWARTLPIGKDFKWTQNEIEIFGTYAGSGRFEHAKQIGQALLPEFEWHDFSEAAVESFSSHEQTAITGPGGTAKSTSAAFYTWLFFLCAPFDTVIPINSTTIPAAKRRIWKPIVEFYFRLRKVVGPLAGQLLSAPTPRIVPIRPDGKYDESSGIHLVPVAKGDEQKAVEYMKGCHKKRVLQVGDETDSISRAAIDVQDNLRAGTIEYQAIWLGNDPSLLNPLGQLMQPSFGKPITKEHHEWTSEVSGVHCLRFDGYESPNIRDNNKWTGLINQRDIDAIIKRNGGENTPGVWIFVHGLHPPEGADNTVLSESLLFRFHCFDSVVWAGPIIASALLDPAFGGDRCVIRKMTRGQAKIEGEQVAGALQHPGLQPTNLRVLFGPPIQLTINAEDKVNPPEYQIAQQAMTFCKANDIPPNEFILDATGTGRGTAAVIQREWSPQILVCEFGGAPSDMILSEENPKPAKDEYDRRVTELYFSFREYVQADVIRGLDQETAREFCQREFDIKGKKYSVMTKSELKADGKPSPDLSDNAVLGTELLRQKGILASIQTTAKIEARDALESRAKQFDLAEDYTSI
jgi:hypothetical protein